TAADQLLDGGNMDRRLIELWHVAAEAGEEIRMVVRIEIERARDQRRVVGRVCRCIARRVAQLLLRLGGAPPLTAVSIVGLYGEQGRRVGAGIGQRGED